ncbi:MAG: TerB family tellurite resistance protein [Propionivibrio sp.]|nr:TerB family tellurite resistance protein [Propionivibrio sp.]
MIASIKGFFSQFIEPGTTQDGAHSGKALQIATAALLLEMMRMDRHIAEEERASVVATLREQFGLEANQLETLLELAEEEARQATSYYQFTSLINKSCSAEQKNRIIENLWHVAMCDGHIDAHENHLMRKIADLLYVGHADYIAAKQRARVSAGLPHA